jgi:lipopolysaccharide heptosyltransferase II
MNVLQILPELNVGGVERGTIDLAKYLVRLGHKAVVVSAGGDQVNDLLALGAVHYKLPVHKKSLINIIKMIPKLAEIINKEKIDIVHARSRVPAWIAYFACRRTRAVFITTCHGYYKRHLFSFVMGWAKSVIAPSNVIARHMIEHFGVPYERVKLIPRSVDLERFKYIDPFKKRKKDFNVGIIGRMTPIKGHLHFIKAMAKVARANPNVKIWIVGDAPASKDAYKEQVRVLVQRLGLWHCTEFLGNQKDIPNILSHLDLLVLATTTQEAFGRVIIEAQAAGVPVVATAVGGVIDIIEDQKTGLIVPPSDPQAMADAIMKVQKDKELARQLAENGYKKVKEKYNVELMVKNTLDLYKDALQNFRVLIIKFSSLGDIILSTAAIRQIRSSLPSSYKISFLVGEESKDILFRCPYIDELLVCDFKNRDKGLLGFLKLAKVLRKRNFDIVIDLQNSRKSHLLSWLTMALNRYGYDNKKLGWLLNNRIKNNVPFLDPVTHQFRILKMLGIDLKEPYLELWPTQADERFIDDFLSSQWLGSQKIVGINIGASKRWLTKVWPMQHLVRLVTELSRKDIRVAITGTAADLETANSLIKKVANIKFINACGKLSVNQLACLIKKCSVYISSDSAPLHVAAAVGVPFIAMFGPTDPRRHLPPAKSFALMKKGLLCSPCYRSKCRKTKCMSSITPEEVLQAIEKLIS